MSIGRSMSGLPVTGKLRLAMCGVALLMAGLSVAAANGMALGLVVAVMAGAFVFLWRIIRGQLILPVTHLAAEIERVAQTTSAGGIAIDRYGGIEPVARAAQGLAEQLRRARTETSRAIAIATHGIEEQKGRLEAILRDLSEGVIICNMEHQMLLYNHMAVRILGAPAEMGLGRSLLRVIEAQPVLHALERLSAQDCGGGGSPVIPVVCGGAGNGGVMEGRISRILDAEGRAGGYVLTFADATRAVKVLGRSAELLSDSIDGQRRSVANIRAAAETLAQYPDMAPEQRLAFDQVLYQESATLSERLTTLAEGHRGLVAEMWPMTDLYFVDLFDLLSGLLEDTPGPRMTMVGIPIWVHADSYALVLALAVLVRRIHDSTRQTALDIGCHATDDRAYLDITWAGEPIASGTLRAWKGLRLEHGMTIRDVLERHASDVWSQKARSGFACLRIPLPIAKRRAREDEPEALPPRPEFYDFALLTQPMPASSLGSQPLLALSYVVFDTETTGLKPSEGDEIVAIAAIRIVNGRILTGETFNVLVDPGRPIPPASTAFHGITQEMIAGKPPIAVALPRFRDFVGDSVVVAHNAAFDLKFIKMKQEVGGGIFDNAVLDTMLLSIFIYGEGHDHSLDANAERFGIAVEGRHTALGDSMATAAVFLRFLEMLAARNINTLDECIRASNMIVEMRGRQEHF